MSELLGNEPSESVSPDSTTALPPPLPKSTPRVWPVFVAVGVVLPTMMLIWAIAFAVLAIVKRFGDSAHDDLQAGVQEAVRNPRVLIPVISAISAANALIAIAGAKLSPLPLRERLALDPGRVGWGSIVLLCLGTVAAGAAAISVVQLLGIHANQGTNQILTDMAKQTSQAGFVCFLVAASLLPALGEELLFRGYAQTRLIARWGPYWGIAISATLFGLIHLDPVQTPDMMLVGVYFGWVAYRTGSTRTSIICHLFNNSVAVAMSVASSEMFQEPAKPRPDQLLITLLAGIVICTVCTALANRSIAQRMSVV